MAETEQKPGFEDSMKRLEEIVTALERGNATLNESMNLFQEGSALIQRCSDMLDAAEQQVVRLKKGPDGAPVELPFDEEAQR